MKKKYPTILSILLITIISACGPTPTPTLSAADVQGTAVADAWIALTLTQAAIPTATANSNSALAHNYIHTASHFYPISQPLCLRYFARHFGNGSM